MKARWAHGSLKCSPQTSSAKLEIAQTDIQATSHTSAMDRRSVRPCHGLTHSHDNPVMTVGFPRSRPQKKLVANREQSMKIGSSHPWTRREVLASTVGATAALSLSPHRAFAAATGGMMAERAARVLTALDDERRRAASFPFESPTRRRWNFMGSSTKPGIPLEKLTSA